MSQPSAWLVHVAYWWISKLTQTSFQKVWGMSHADTIQIVGWYGEEDGTPCYCTLLHLYIVMMIMMMMNT